MLKLLAFVLPLGLDSFAVAAALGASQVSTAWQRLRISLVFVIFEGGMPLIGLVVGSALARGIGRIADYLAAAAVIGIGIWMLLADNEDEEDKASRIMTSHGLALVGLGISAVLAEAAARCDYRIGTQHLLLALFYADDQAAAQALARLGAGESQVREAMTAVLAETGPEPPA